MRQPVLKRNRAQPCIGIKRLQEVLVSAPKPLLRDIIMLSELFRPLGSAKLLPVGEAQTWCNRKYAAYINGSTTYGS